jgi:hypothetical protein
MEARTSILDIEARLGFNFRRGLSKEQRAKKTATTSRLLKGLHSLNNKHVLSGHNEIRNSQEIKREAEELFNELGRHLWPFGEPIPTWLLQP